MKKLFLIFIMIAKFQLYSQIIGWASKPNLPGNARSGAFFFQIDGKFYLGGGDNNAGGALADFWEYNPQTDTWQSKANFGGGNNKWSTAFVVNGKGYVVSGTDGVTNFKTVWQYDPALNLWTQKADCPISARFSFVILNKGYVGLGPGYGNNISYFYEYNESNDTWVQKTNAPDNNRTQAFSVNDRGYIVTENITTNPNISSKVYEYNPIGDSWSQKNNPPFNLSNATCISTNGFGYIIGGGIFFPGFYPYYLTSKTYKYNPASDTWLVIPSSDIYCTTLGSLFTYNNRLYYGTGFQQNCQQQGNAGHTVVNWLMQSTFEVGLEENSLKGNFNVHPNPVANNLTIDLQKNKYNISLFDLLGSEVMRLENATGKQEIQLNSLNKGVYILRVGEFTKKIIKE